MVSNLDIWRAANQLIREHGAPALISKQHARMFDRGDDEGRLVWDADQARGRGAAGAAVGNAKLKPRRIKLNQDRLQAGRSKKG